MDEKVLSKTYQGESITHDFDAEIDALISQMTLEEKTGMLHGTSMFSTAGVERLGVPELKMADGPLGVREEISRDSWAPAGLDNDFATYYPAGGGLSATWNTDWPIHLDLVSVKKLVPEIRTCCYLLLLILLERL